MTDRSLDGNVLQLLLRAIRVHQWPKNFLVALPLLASQRLFEVPLLIATLQSFLAFSLTASTIYLINDLVDLEHDRKHPEKRRRPFAAGTLSPNWGYVLIPCLVTAATVLAITLSWALFFVLAGYALLTVLYSTLLKRLLILDVIVIAIFYGLRVIAGYEATGLDYSVWLLAFTQFLFGSLAFMKRDIELGVLSDGPGEAPGRGYQTQDRLIISAFGIASGLVSVLVFSLYIDSDIVAQLYRAPWVLWFACPLLAYGLGRMWLLANRGVVHGDPLLFVLRDPASYLIGGTLIVVVLTAKFGLPTLTRWL
jgi:4-hydroxybenzoate polyprenyltransferase